MPARWLLFWLLLAAVPQSVARGEEPLRMPEYPEAAPPPARTQAEVSALLAGARPPSEPQPPLRIVLVAGPKDHGRGEHDYPAWQQVWSRLLVKAPDTQVDTAWEFPTADQIKAADVLVFYQRGQWDDDRAAAIDPFLARGGGLVYLHWAVDGRGQEAAMAQRIGLAALGGRIRYRHGELNVDFSPAGEHPIARNFSSMRWVDESYWELAGDASKLTLLGQAVEEGAPRPQFWTVERGRGRVFVSIPGHYMWTFDDPLFRTLIFRGIAWAGHRDVDRFNEFGDGGCAGGVAPRDRTGRNRRANVPPRGGSRISDSIGRPAAVASATIDNCPAVPLRNCNNAALFHCVPAGTQRGSCTDAVP